MDTHSTLCTRSSTGTRETEAVIQPPTRTTSVRSGVSGYSFQASKDAHEQTHIEMTLRQLVPFTSAT